MKKLLLLSILSLCICGQIMADGYLNIITGRPAAKIFVDGEYIGNDYVRRLPLAEGEHYIRVENNGKLMYAKMVTIYSDEVSSITSENFVDIKTKTANRGAIDREAERLAETKGKFGMGIQAGVNYPSSGLSLKYLPTQFWAIQFSGMANLPAGDYDHSQAGVRVIRILGNKILSNAVFSGYVSFGYSRLDKDHQTDSSKSYEANVYGLSIGAEFALVDPLYISLEAGTIFESKDGGSTSTGLGASAGIHFYF